MSNAVMPKLVVPAPKPPKTVAERALADAFAVASNTLPGGGWVARVRGDAMRWFEANGLPSRRVEAFKYTDLRERLKNGLAPATAAPVVAPTAADVDAALGPLARIDGPRLVFVDGVYSAELSRTASFGDAVEQMALAPLLRKAPGWLEGKFAAGRLGETNALTSLNTAFMSDGLMIKVKPGQRADKPVMVVNARASATAGMVATRNIVAMEAGSAMTLVEAFVVLPGVLGTVLPAVYSTMLTSASPR